MVHDLHSIDRVKQTAKVFFLKEKPVDTQCRYVHTLFQCSNGIFNVWAREVLWSPRASAESTWHKLHLDSKDITHMQNDLLPPAASTRTSHGNRSHKLKYSQTVQNVKHIMNSTWGAFRESVIKNLIQFPCFATFMQGIQDKV